MNLLDVWCGKGSVFVSFANQLSLYRRVSISIPFENFAGQKLINNLHACDWCSTTLKTRFVLCTPEDDTKQSVYVGLLIKLNVHFSWWNYSFYDTKYMKNMDSVKIIFYNELYLSEQSKNYFELKIKRVAR